MALTCSNRAIYRYTWPGNDESVICDSHARQIKKVAEVIGLHLQLIPLSEEDLKLNLTCDQILEVSIEEKHTGEGEEAAP